MAKLDGAKVVVIGGASGVGFAVAAAAYVALNPYVLLLFTAGPLKPPTPPLLKEGGSQRLRTHYSGCPPWDPIELHNPGGIEDRVAKAFPPGTSQEFVIRSLSQQGFKVEAPCASDPTVRDATFSQSGGGFYGPYPAYSMVTWKVDQSGKVVWTSGWVAYTGP